MADEEEVERKQARRDSTAARSSSLKPTSSSQKQKEIEPWSIKDIGTNWLVTFLFFFEFFYLFSFHFPFFFLHIC